MSGSNYAFTRKRKAKERREKQYEMVLDLGPLFEHPPEGLIHDTSLLPHSKAELVEALLEFMGTAKNAQFVDLCTMCLASLTHYQDGVGSRSISIPELPETFDPQAMQAAMAASGFDRFNEFSKLMSDDLSDMTERMNEAKKANLHLQPEWKKRWQKFRKTGLYSMWAEVHDFP